MGGIRSDIRNGIRDGFIREEIGSIMGWGNGGKYERKEVVKRVGVLGWFKDFA